ncbi:hypothetical protein B4098_3095 [Heyndrickxia coagulans]|uniref:Uncharacterized protein n=1 Tax=Heyndrickxia coagulans TaxID=1398 RepID=A0A150KGL2_HEYCO|nr:hypothetical protein B4098_3095 [Heyndrickxia coagulans]KYC69883.1 hypothetical protein B4099_3159 [Heyndrickxia coagulans]
MIPDGGMLHKLQGKRIRFKLRRLGIVNLFSGADVCPGLFLCRKLKHFKSL